MLKILFQIIFFLILFSCIEVSEDDGIPATLPEKSEPCEIKKDLEEIKSKGCMSNFIYTKLNYHAYLTMNISNLEICRRYDLSNPFTIDFVEVLYEKNSSGSYCTYVPNTLIINETDTIGGKYAVEYFPVKGNLLLMVNDSNKISFSIENAVFVNTNDTIEIPNFKSTNIDASFRPG